MSSLLTQLSKASAAVVEHVRDAVVCVGQGKARPRSGYIIAPGEIVTPARAAEPGETVPVHLTRPESGEQEIAATVKGFDETSSIALLEAPGVIAPDLPATRLPAVGELSIAVAAPIPGHAEARLGVIRCVGGQTRLAGGRRIDAYIQTDAGRFRGFSGSVLFGSEGEPFGITMPGGPREESFVIPTSIVIDIVAKLREGKSFGRAYIGVRTVPAQLSAAIGETTDALLVTAVEAGAPAAQADIRVGDFIYEVDGAELTTVEDLIEALLGHSEGEEIAAKIVRNGTVEERTLRVTTRR